MKITLLLNSDIHSKTALDLLLPVLRNHEVRIILSQKIGRMKNLPPELALMQKNEQEKNIQLDGVESVVCDDVNSRDALEDLQNFAPDLVISIRFGQILKQLLIDIPRYGVINLHSGILPNYRGVLPSFWAILNGEKKLGTSLHFISDAGIDSGDVIAFSEGEIDWDLSLSANINRLYSSGCRLVCEAIEKIAAGKAINRITQKSLGAGQYFSYPTMEEVRRFLTIYPKAFC